MEKPTPHEIHSLEWPVASQDLLADAAALESTHAPEQINQPLFALIRARKALNDARLSLMRASQLWASQPAVRDRLVSLAAEMTTAHDRFPLHVINRRKTWRNASEWAQPAIAPEVMTTAPRERVVKLERPLSNEEANAALHRVVREMIGKAR